MGIVRRLFRTLIILVLLAVLALGVSFYWFNEPGPVAKSGDATIVQFDRGMGVYDIAQKLKAEGLVTDAGFFAIWVRLSGNGTQLRAGEYSIPSRASMAEILQILKHGKAILHRLTIPEGLTTMQVLRLVEANDVLTGDVGKAPPEGALLPETYSFPRGTSRAEVVAMMRRAHETLMARIWPDRAEGLPFKTQEEAVTLASIVEKETAKPDERGRIAAVFVNRLKRGMLLQSDPTVIYGLTGGEPLGRGLKQSELQKPTPYNTYLKAGLPPTPIANPGKASLEAVLNPPATKELYFVADGSGGHVFATTLAQHEANVRKWRKFEREFLSRKAPALRRLP